MANLNQYLSAMVDSTVYKIIISKPVSKTQDYLKVVIEQKETGYQVTRYTEKQAFHQQITVGELADTCAELVEGQFLQVNGWGDDVEHMILLSKKGTCSYKKRQIAHSERAVKTVEGTHNRKKKYLLEEGVVVPALVDMGVFTKDGKVVQSMYDKYKQINRFLEILDDEISGWKQPEINLIDFGCGKSYLTFVVYHYLTQIKGMKANIIGLDLKADVVKKCNQASQKYGYDGLKFALGDINGYQTPFDVDVVITLHACDTATDFALFNAVQWNAKMIFSVPCCQHELNGQIQPETFGILSQYGILKERFSAIATDAIRGNLLEYCGYKTQLLEFVDFSHTPKNILIRAVKRTNTPKAIKENMLGQVERLMKEFSFQPTLYQLLNLDKEGRNIKGLEEK